MHSGQLAPAPWKMAPIPRGSLHSSTFDPVKFHDARVCSIENPNMPCPSPSTPGTWSKVHPPPPPASPGPCSTIQPWNSKAILGIHARIYASTWSNKRINRARVKIFPAPGSGDGKKGRRFHGRGLGDGKKLLRRAWFSWHCASQPRKYDSCIPRRYWRPETSRQRFSRASACVACSLLGKEWCRAWKIFRRS